MTFDEFMRANFGTYSSVWTHGTSWTFYDTTEDPVYKRCIQDAVEHFQSLNIKNSLVRINLTKEQKERIVGFLKERKKYYDEHGLLLGEEYNFDEEQEIIEAYL